MASWGYYDPNSSYGRDPFWEQGWGEGFYDNTVYGPTGYLENNVPALWTRFTTPWASGTDPFSKFVQGEFSKFWDSYDAAWATNPDLLKQDWVGQFGEGDFRQRFNQLTPGQRGENPSRFGGGRMQWIL
jgi:hypothetical protein